MPDEKQPLQDSEIDEVASGLYIGGKDGTTQNYEPYTSTCYPISCPKCNSSNIWYKPGVFGQHESASYWCKACDLKFKYNDLSVFGASCDW